MEVQLKELIQKIKKQGIAQAENKAQAIENDANKKAATIIKQANKDAEKIIAEAKQQAASFKTSSEQAIQQAGRDLLLMLKTKIMALFDSFLQAEVKQTLKKEMLKDLLGKVIKSWIDKGITDIEIMVSSADLKILKSYCLSKFAGNMKKGITIKPLSTIEAGFRIMEKGGTAYYNITDQGITEFLLEYLSPKISAILTEMKMEKKNFM